MRTSTEMTTYDSASLIKAALGEFNRSDLAISQTEHVFACRLGGGVLRFCATVFPEVDTSEIWAQSESREPTIGKGAHFDLYNGLVDEDFPWFGVYNLAGRASLRSTILADELAQYYDRLHPEADDAAYNARRRIAEEALDHDSSPILVGQISAGTGIVLPVPKSGKYIVHEVKPDGSGSGRYIKILKPKDTDEARDILATAGMKPLDDALTELAEGKTPDQAPSLIHVPHPDEQHSPAQTPTFRSSSGRRDRFPESRRRRID